MTDDRMMPLPPGYVLEVTLGRGALGTSAVASKKGDPQKRVFKQLAQAEWLDELPLLRLPGLWLGGKSSIDGNAWLWTRHVPEGSLRSAMSSGLLSAADLAKILVSCLEILEKLHGEGAVHGGLKPENILLPAREGVVLTDVGHLPFLRSRDEEAARAYLFGTVVSRSTSAPFTYLPPEAMDIPVNEPRADVYAVGAILREGLQGQGGRPPIPRLLRGVVGSLTSGPGRSFPSAAKARALLSSVPASVWKQIPLIGTTPGTRRKEDESFSDPFTFIDLPDRPEPVGVALPAEISVFEVAGGPPADSPRAEAGGGGGDEDEPEALDPSEALKFLETRSAPKKPAADPSSGKKKPPAGGEKEAGAYGLVVMGAPSGTKREAIAVLIGNYLDLTDEEAQEKATEPIISVLRGVTKIEAERAYKKFRDAKVSARITTRLKKQS